MRGELPSTQTRVRDGLGALRDTIGAVGNLDQLLRSSKVGPKAIASVLPDILASCPPLENEIQSAVGLLSPRFAAGSMAALGSFILQQVEELKSAVNAAATGQRGVSAGARLGLERAIGQVQHNLTGALPLLEVVTEVAFSSRIPLDLHELLVLLRDGDQSRGLRGQVVRAGLEPGSGPLTLLSSPRSMLTLIALSGALANADNPTPTLSIGLRRSEDDEGTLASLTASAVAPLEPRLRIVLPPVVPPTEACVAAVAQAMGLHFVRGDQRVAFSWREQLVRPS